MMHLIGTQPVLESYDGFLTCFGLSLWRLCMPHGMSKTKAITGKEEGRKNKENQNPRPPPPPQKSSEAGLLGGHSLDE